MKRAVIGGIKSGSGKTTVACAIMKAFTERGDRVAPFKCGPDYIDPMFHKHITGRSSHNLDSWMMDADTVRYLFNKNSSGAGLALIEGVMGLYDGLGGTTRGSTAEIAKILDAPVILTVDGSGMSASIAAMISGYVNFDREVKIRGVILNNISGGRHYRLLRDIISRDTGIRCLGFLPRTDEAAFKSRHLGLIPAGELIDIDRKISALAGEASENIDLDGILEIAGDDKHEDIKAPRGISKDTGSGLRIAVAMDRAFNFYYQENLDIMKESGMELVEFSPIEDRALPDGIHGLYLGGGYPEVFAGELSANRSMLKDIRDSATTGLPVYAECGGLMYLTRSITDIGGKENEMSGFIKCGSRMTGKLQRFGYVEIDYLGTKTRGHEFHHSVLTDFEDGGADYKFTVKRASDGETWKCGLSKGNVLAGYPHIHFYSNLDFFEKLTAIYRSGGNDIKTR